jgi:uncharacterized protein (TIGR02466 family)
MGNTTSIDNTILKSKELTQLRDFIETKVSEYFTTVYSPKHKVNLKITQSWTNYTDKGQYHHKHEHPNSFVSGVFYVQADRQKTGFTFTETDTSRLSFHPLIGMCGTQNLGGLMLVLATWYCSRQA